MPCHPSSVSWGWGWEREGEWTQDAILVWGLRAARGGGLELLPGQSQDIGEGETGFWLSNR